MAGSMTGRECVFVVVCCFRAFVPGERVWVWCHHHCRRRSDHDAPHRVNETHPAPPVRWILRSTAAPGPHTNNDEL